MRKIIVCGGHKYRNKDLVYRILYGFAPDVIVHGDCDTGADRLAQWWAEELGRRVIAYPSDVATLGKGADAARNWEMAKDNPDAFACIAFPGGDNVDCMTQEARGAGIPVLQVLEPTNE